MSLIEDLDDESRRDLSRLAAWLCRWPNSSLTAGPAAALLNVNAEAASDRLDQFWRMDLVDAHDGERFHLVGLARERAGELARDDAPDERDAAFARAISYYLHAAAAADALVSPQAPRVSWPYGQLMETPSLDIDTERAALAWFDAMMPSLVAGQAIAIEIEAWELAYPVAALIGHWLDARRDHTVWELVCERAIEAAQRCKNRMGEAAATRLLARAHYDLGHLTQAHRLADHAQGLSWGIGDQIGAAEALADLAMFYLADDNTEDAFPLLRSAQDLVGEDPRYSWLGVVLRRRLGTATAMADELEHARTHFRYAVQTAAALADDHQQGRTLASLGLAELEAGNASEAVAAVEDAVTVLGDCDRPYALARAHWLAATAHRHAGHLEPARRHIEDALAIYQDAPTPREHPAFVDALTLAAELRLTVPAGCAGGDSA